MWKTDVMVQGTGATARATPGAGGPRRRARGEGAGTGPREAPVSPARDRSLWGGLGDKKGRGHRGKVRGRELGVQGVLDGRPSEKQRKGRPHTGGPSKSRLLSLLPKGTEDRGAASISGSHQRNTHLATEEAKKEETQ